MGCGDRTRGDDQPILIRRRVVRFVQFDGRSPKGALARAGADETGESKTPAVERDGLKHRIVHAVVPGATECAVVGSNTVWRGRCGTQVDARPRVAVDRVAQDRVATRSRSDHHTARTVADNGVWCAGSRSTDGVSRGRRIDTHAAAPVAYSSQTDLVALYEVGSGRGSRNLDAFTGVAGNQVPRPAGRPADGVGCGSSLQTNAVRTVGEGSASGGAHTNIVALHQVGGRASAGQPNSINGVAADDVASRDGCSTNRVATRPIDEKAFVVPEGGISAWISAEIVTRDLVVAAGGEIDSRAGATIDRKGVDGTGACGNFQTVR